MQEAERGLNLGFSYYSRGGLGVRWGGYTKLIGNGGNKVLRKIFPKLKFRQHGGGRPSSPSSSLKNKIKKHAP